MVMLLHPARYYIHYLLSRRSLSDEKILERLRAGALPVPTDEDDLEDFLTEIAKTRKSMKFPAGFDPRRPGDDDMDFMKKWGISDMWRNDTYVSNARRSLDDPGPLRMLRVLLLSPLQPKAIADRVRSRYGLSNEQMNPRVVKSFAHYFWNYNALDRDRWVQLLLTWMPGRCDDMVAAIRAPRTQGGAALAISLADHTGAGETPAEVIYSTARELAFQRFMDHMMGKSNLSSTQGAAFALEMVIKADNELDKRRGGSAEIMREFERIQPIYDKPNAVLASELYTNPVLTEGDVIDVKATDDE